MRKLSYISDEDYKTLLNEVVNSLIKEGFTSEDFTSEEHNNKTVKHTISELVYDYIESCDGFNHLERDLGTFQKYDLNEKLYDSVIEHFKSLEPIKYIMIIGIFGWKNNNGLKNSDIEVDELLCVKEVTLDEAEDTFNEWLTKGADSYWYQKATNKIDFIIETKSQEIYDKLNAIPCYENQVKLVEEYQ